MNRCEETICDQDTQCETGFCCTQDKCNAFSERGAVCIKKPGDNNGGDTGGNKTVVIVLSIIGVILFLGLVALGVMYYRRQKQMEILRQELAKSTASQRRPTDDHQALLNN